MAEIKLQIQALDKSIQNLQDLKSKCEFIDMKEPDTQGGGKTINEIENMITAYKSIHKSLGVLLTNTISSLSTTKTSFVTADKNAAAQITK